MEIVVLWLLLSLLVAWFASTRGRNVVLAFLVAVAVSPLIGFLAYLIAGESAAAMRQRIAEEERLRAEARMQMDRELSDGRSRSSLKVPPGKSWE